MRGESPAARRPKFLPLSVQNDSTHAGAKELGTLFLLTAGAILVHGYHPFVEDAEIYVPGIRKLLNPELYPVNDGFFASHARMTLFPNLMAWSVRVTHLPLEWALLAWHFVCIFLLLLSCWKLARFCFGTTRAAWGSAALLASLLTLPVAGTALYIMDQYVNTRSFSTAAAIWIVLAVLQKKYAHAAVWVVISAVIHPLMAGFMLVFAGLLAWKQFAKGARTQAAFAILLPGTFFPPVTDAYRQVLESHPYFFLVRWQWYEWLGIIGPLAILWWYGRIARRRDLAALEALCSTTVLFGLIFLAAGLVITVPQSMTRFVELQPMRSLQLTYILLIAISGGLIAEYVLKAQVWRWGALYISICAGMFYAQRQLFPATPHLEWPDAGTSNEWVQAFRWIRDNTPVNACFALDPEHMRLAGEDQHGFRAIAERSRLADNVKDSGSVTMFPALAATWQEQTRGEEEWKSFTADDFARLRRQYGVDWVVVQQSGVAGLECPYRNSAVLVCRVPEGTSQ